MGSSELGASDPTLTGSRTDGGASADDRFYATHRRIPIAAGSAIGRYLVLSKLGEGAMGVVHAAYDPELDRKVAIKLLKPIGAARNLGRAKARLLAEAQALAKVNHPNVVTVHDVGTTDEHVWLAMEFVEGSTLARWRQDRQPGWKVQLATMLAAGAGLAAVHAAGLVHRDFKPANLMVSDDGRVRVMDFGLARQDIGVFVTSGAAALGGNQERTVGGGGTPAYMAPEQHAGEAADARADQFAFCVVLWELLYGKRPFEGSGMTDVVLAITEGQIARPARNHRVPGWVHRALVRGLSVDPAARWPSMKALLEVLARGHRRARNTWLGATAGLLAASVWGGLGYASIQEQRARAECKQGARAATTELERRVAVLGDLEDDTRSRVEAIAMEFAEDWATAAEATCIEASVELAVPASLAGRGEACLDDQLAHMSAYLDLVDTGDLNANGRALDGAYGLPDPTRCRDVRRLETAPWPSEAQRPEVFRIRRMLATATAQLQAGRFAEAEAETAKALVDATTLDWRPLVAQCQYHHAWALLRLSRLDEATGELAEAFHTSLREEDDALAADAAITLLDASRLAHRFDEARAWGEHAESTLARVGTDRDEHRISLDSSRASLAMEAGDYANACDALRAALARKQESRGRRRPDVASLLTHLGLCESYRGNLDSAAAILDEALDLRRDLYGDVHPDVAESILNQAVLAYQRRDDELALAGFNEAIRVAVASAGEELVFSARVRVNLAATYSRLDRLDEAAAELQRALPILEAALGPEHGDVAAALNNLALIDEKAGKLDASLSRFEDTYELKVRTLGEAHASTGRAASNVGRLHRLRGDPHPAVEWGQRARAVLTAALGPDHRDTARASEELALAHLDIGAGGAAEVLLRDALRIFRATDAAAGTVLGTRLGLAEALRLQGRVEEALAEVDAVVQVAADADDPKLVSDVAEGLEQRGLAPRTR